jgi:hypothetical protein
VRVILSERSRRERYPILDTGLLRLEEKRFVIVVVVVVVEGWCAN